MTAEQSAVVEIERNGLSAMLMLFAASRELAIEAETDALRRPCIQWEK